MNQPANQSYTMMPKAPTVRRAGRNSVISGREQSFTVSGSTTFAATRYRINPGLSTRFPWLQLQAQGWEKYRFRRLSATFVPSAAAADTVGQTQMAWDYDPSDSAPSTEVAMSAYEGSNAKAVRYSSTINLDCSTIGFRKLRCGNVAGDLMLYDAASLILATNACASGAVIGTLWLDYDVEFEHKQVEPATPTPTTFSSIYLSAANTCATGVGEVLPFDTWTVNGLEIADPVAGVFTPPCGNYVIEAVTSHRDSAAEAFIGVIGIRKNGVLEDTLSKINTTAIANGQVPLVHKTYVSCDGTDTVDLYVTLTGAAGTLTNTQDYNTLTFRAV